MVEGSTALVIPKELLILYLKLLNYLSKSHPVLNKGVRKMKLFVLLSLALSSAEDRLPIERSFPHASADNTPQKES